jgi:hypothetical protein
MVSTLLTRFPNGISQFTLAAVGASAGDMTCTGVVKATDRLLHVRVDTLNATTGCITASNDLTSEFTISANDTVNNTGGTSCAGKNVLVTIARAKS